jgi:hypothetical protein
MILGKRRKGVQKTQPSKSEGMMEKGMENHGRIVGMDLTLLKLVYMG